MKPNQQPARGIQPFWFWNGEIRADEITRQIRAMKAQGVRGFFLHPRQGMDLPYFSNRFLEMVGVAVETARRERMDMWLYDEYPYPSGVAGGELLLKPEYSARVLQHELFQARGHVERKIPWGQVLLARAYRLCGGKPDWDNHVDLRSNIGIIYEREILQDVGLSSYNRKRYFTGSHAKRLWWDAPEGDWLILLFLECEMGDFKYFGGFIDPVNPNAIRDYIRLTHERYYQAFPEAFGPVIKGIYTDETSPMGSDPMWSPLMPALYEARCGESLLERLPAFAIQTDGDDEKFLYDYHDTLYRAFVKSYDQPIHDWCEAHGVLYTGEKVHLRAEQMRFMHIPGIDSGHVKAGAKAPLHSDYHRINAKSAASYAHFAGHNIALCEAYHSLSWDATLRDLRWIADWLTVQGIDLLVPHAYYYTDDALRKYDAPPSLFESMPWYAWNTLLTEHTETTGDLVREGKRVVHTLIVDPSGVMNAQRQPVIGNESVFAQLEAALAKQHIDYYIVDRDLLQEITADHGLIRLRGETFRALLLPGLPVAEQETLDAAQHAAAAGVQVIAIGCMPRRNINTGLDIARETQENSLVTLPEECAARLAETLPTVCRISENDAPCADILAARFFWRDADWLYTVNMTKEEHCCTLSLPDAVQADIEQIIPHTGETLQVKGFAAAFRHEYAPFECALFRTGKTVAQEQPEAQIVIDPFAAWTCAAQTENLLRIGVWDAELGNNHVRVDSKPIINQLIDSKCEIQAVEKSDFGCVKRLQFPSMALHYRFRFNNQYNGPVRLVMEPGSIHGEYTVTCNGKPAPTAMETRFVFKRTNISCDITSLLQQDINELTVRVTATKDDDGVVNPLYLTGDFAVYQSGGVWGLYPPARQASPMELTEGGFPFFSGVMEYDVSRLFVNTKSTRCAVAIRDWHFEHCAELLVNGQSQGAAAWQPYRWNVTVPPGARVLLRVFGTMLAAYEGAQFDQDTHAKRFLQTPEG